VREDSLHRVALMLGLPELVRLSEGEARGGGAQRPSILADALEAVIGAVFTDGGYEPAQALVRQLFGDTISSSELDAWTKDAKTELQEWLQARQLPLPAYALLEESGDDHDKRFRVGCTLAEPPVTSDGVGTSRRAAEQAAAEAALAQLH